MGREFVHTIYGGNQEEHHVQEEDIHTTTPPEEPKSLLESVQTSIRNNQPNTFELAPDKSISIHSCHSPGP